MHTGPAYFGSVSGPDGMYNITALGEEVNTAARLAAKAEIGELIASHEAMNAAGLNKGDFESRELKLKGLSEKVGVSIVRVN